MPLTGVPFRSVEQGHQFCQTGRPSQHRGGLKQFFRREYADRESNRSKCCSYMRSDLGKGVAELAEDCLDGSRLVIDKNMEPTSFDLFSNERSEERRVGKECRSR